MAFASYYFLNAGLSALQLYLIRLFMYRHPIPNRQGTVTARPNATT